MKATKPSAKTYHETVFDKKKHLSYRCIAEDSYQEQMEQLVEPYLRQRISNGTMDGLYYEFYEHPSPKATIVISFGFTESCEKYHELIYYMHREGYQAAVIEHRGHGKSLREVNDLQLVHVEDFSQYVDDLHRFVQTIVRPKAGNLPLYLYAHSMGGCIGTLYLEQHPGVFKKAVLNAPMLGIFIGSTPDLVARFLCRGAITFGKKKKKLFTMKDFDPQEPFANSAGDSPARHNYYQKLRRENSAYRTNCATYNWAYQALRAGKRAIAPKHAAHIQIPVLLFQAANDTFVRAKEQDLFLSRIENGRKIIVDSRHEINRMTSDRLEAYLAEIFEFYQAGY